jgi:hypothetical protein
VAKNGEHLADNGEYLRFLPSKESVNALTGKVVHNELQYEYDDGKIALRVTYSKKEDIINFKMIDQLHGLTKLGAKLIGFDGAYHRFSGDVTLEQLEHGQVSQRVSANALWELMFFGKNIRK